MTTLTQTPQISHSKFSGKTLALIFSTISIVIGTLDIMGWIFHIPFLRSLLVSQVNMKITTSFCFIFAASALVFINLKGKRSLYFIIPILTGFFVFCIGLYTSWVHLTELISGQHSALASAPFFKQFLSIENRMALLTSLNFSFLGIAIIFLSFRRNKFTGIAHLLILPVLMVNYFIPVSYLLGILSVTSINNIPVAFNTSIAFIFISLAVLFTNTKSWFMKVFTGMGSGSLMARRLLPFLLILPFIIAWLRNIGEDNGYFDAEIGVILFTVFYVVMSVLLTWLGARSANNSDIKRQASDEAKNRIELELHSLFMSMNEGLIYFDVIYKNGAPVDFSIVDINPAWQKIVGKNSSYEINGLATNIFKDKQLKILDIFKQVAEGSGPQVVDSYFAEYGKHFKLSIYSPEYGKLIIFLSDITNEKNVEKILKKSHTDLENLVKERTSDLIQANLLLKDEIVERSKAEVMIKAEQKRFNDVLELLPAYLILLSEDYHVPYANKFFRERFGESHGKRCYEYLFNRTEPCEVCETFKVFKTDLPLTWEWTGPDNRNYSIFDFPFTDVDGSRLVMEMGIDVTELKQKEAEIRELNRFLEHKVVERSADLIKSNEQHKKSQEMAHLGSWELDIKTNNIIWSDEVYRIFGMNPQERNITYGDFIEAVHPDDRELVNNVYTESIKNGLDSYDLKHRIINKTNGAIRYVHEKCEHIRDEEGIITRSVGMIHDITEQVEANEKLMQSESKVRLKLESILSPEGNISSLDLYDILDIPMLQSLMENFNHLTSIPMAIIDLNGVVIVKAGWQDVCTKYHRVNPESSKNCILSDIELSAGIPEGEFKLYKCRNNLWDMATPIIIGGEHKGNLFMGQFFFDDEKPDLNKFKEQAKKYGFNEAEYIKMISEVPHFSRTTIQFAKDFFLYLSHSLSNLSYSNIKLAHSISEQERISTSLKKNNERLDLLSYIASQLLSSTDPQNLVDELCTRVMKILDCQAFFNYLVDEKAGKLHLNACAGIADKTVHAIEWQDYGIAVCGCVARDAERIIAENIPETPDPRTELIKSFGIKAYCCHPIMAQGKVLGTLSFGTKNSIRFNDEDIALMKAVTDQVAIAMNRIINEKKLHENREQLSAVFNGVSETLMLIDIEGNVIAANKIANDRLNNGKNDFAGKNIFDVVPVRFHNQRKKQIAELIETKKPIKFLDNLGDTFLEMTFYPVFNVQGNVDQYISSALDITERIKSEEALRQTSDRLNMAQNAAKIGTWDWNVVTGHIEWSKQMFELFGLDPYKTKVSFDVWERVLHPEDVEIAGHRIDDALKQHTLLNSDYRIVLPDGRIHWINSVGEGKYNAEGEPVRMIGICIDITDRKSAEEALRESETRYRLLVDSLPGTSIHLFDNNKRFLIAGGGEITKAGFDRSAIEGHTLSEAYPLPIVELLGPLYDNALKGEYTSIIHKFGESWFHQQVIPVMGSKGEIYAGMVISQNITESKKTEDALKESENRFRSIAETLPVLISMSRMKDGIILYTNPAYDKAFGYEPGSLISKIGPELYVDPADRDKLVEVLKKQNSVRNYNVNVKKNDGTPFWLSCSIQLIDFEGEKVFLSASVDITERLLAEKELNETKNYLENLINYANAPIIVWNPMSEIQLFNGAFQNLTGYSSTEVIGKRIDILFPKASLEESNKKIKQALSQHWETIEIPILTKNNETRIVLWNSANVFDVDKTTLIAVIAQGQDITEMKKAEKELSESKEKLDLALDNGSIGIWEWDINSNTLEWDERMENIFGLEPGTFGGNYDAFEKFLVDEDVAHTRKAVSDALELDIPFETAYRIKLNNCEIKHISAKALVNKDSEGAPLKMIGVCYDITEMKKGAEKVLIKLTDDLLRSNKELEQFAYVASHDLQEPLRMVSSYTQLLAQRYKDKLDQDAKDFINFAVDGASRMQVLINDLLSFSRIETKGKDFEHFDMHAILGYTINNLLIQIKEKNALITNDELPVVFCDQNQIMLLLQNLLGNAIKYCDDSPRIHISSHEENGYYIFSVKDNGIGIEPQYFNKIFQIFQRLHSREEYSGTGIGLAICKRIIERHRGKIWLDSELGKGTTFYFSLPKTEGSI